jgi:nucleotide-binding universal stress UspA family protein
MAQRRFPVLVATDGSAQARAAVEAALVFPWPHGSTGHGVVARATPVLTDASPAVWEALLEVGRAEARRAERRLRRRWPDGDVFVTDAPPVRGILRHARTLRARAIVLGSRGLGSVGRLLLGSVSRGVVRQAPCAVLVVRGSVRPPRRFLIGVDGSPHARAAVAFVSSISLK